MVAMMNKSLTTLVLAVRKARVIRHHAQIRLEKVMAVDKMGLVLLQRLVFIPLVYIDDYK